MPKRIQPRGNSYVSGFRNRKEYMASKGISKSTFDSRRRDGKIMIVYTRVPAPKGRTYPWRWQRTMVETYEFMSYLHMRGDIDLYDENWAYLTKKLRKDRRRWKVLPKLSEQVNEKIQKALLPHLIEIIEEDGDYEDRMRLKSLYKITEHDQTGFGSDGPESLSKDSTRDGTIGQ